MIDLCALWIGRVFLLIGGILCSVCVLAIIADVTSFFVMNTILSVRNRARRYDDTRRILFRIL